MFLVPSESLSFALPHFQSDVVCQEIRKVDDVRDDITKIDYEIAELFEKRMGFAAELALSKKQAGESIYNKNKEDEKLSDITKNRSNPFVIKG